MSDEIVLTVPRQRRFYDVARLVVSGLAARLDATVDNLSDLQLAFDGLLPRDEHEGDVTVVLRLDGAVLDGRIGPFHGGALRRELEHEGGDGYGMHHVLEAVFERYSVEETGADAWVTFTMGLRSAGAEA